MRLIDADELIVFNIDEGAKPFRFVPAEFIENAPTVDAVQVVRCKDCVWYKIAELTKDGRPNKRYKPSFCLMWRQFLSENNYCSYGDKEKNEADKRG